MKRSSALFPIFSMICRESESAQSVSDSPHMVIGSLDALRNWSIPSMRQQGMNSTLQALNSSGRSCSKRCICRAARRQRAAILRQQMYWKSCPETIPLLLMFWNTGALPSSNPPMQMGCRPALQRTPEFIRLLTRRLRQRGASVQQIRISRIFPCGRSWDVRFGRSSCQEKDIPLWMRIILRLSCGFWPPCQEMRP